MARGRMLNKKVSRSKQFDQLPDDTCRLLATWTIAHLDVNGVFYADPVMIRSLIFPRRTDITPEQIALYLDAMEQAGLIVRYNANNEVWQYWPGFRDNQVGLRADRERPDYPPPAASLRQYAGQLPDNDGIDAGYLPAEHEEEENRSEGEEEAGGSRVARDRQVCAVYIEYTHRPITGGIAHDLLDLVKETEEFRLGLPRGSPGGDVSGDEWVCEAIREMGRSGIANGNVKYVNSVVTRWREEGYKSPRKGVDNGRGFSVQRNLDAVDEWLEATDGKP